VTEPAAPPATHPAPVPDARPAPHPPPAAAPDQAVLDQAVLDQAVPDQAVLDQAGPGRAGLDQAARPTPLVPPGSTSWLVATVSLVFAANALFSRYLFTDTFYDLYTGRYIVQHGLPRTNVATLVSHGARWTDQQWLAHVAFYGAWLAGGYHAVAIFSALLVTSGFAIAALLMLRRGVPPPRAFAWTVAAFAVCMGNTGIRAQSFAYPCFALTLWLVLGDSRPAMPAPRRPAPAVRPADPGPPEVPRPWPLARTWLVLPVLVLWANTHGSVLLGTALTSGYAACRAAWALSRRERKAAASYLALAAAAAATVLCTPYGTEIAWYYRRFIDNPALTHNIVEWATPSPLNLISWAFFAMLLAVVAVAAIAWRRGTRPDPVLAAITVILLAFALTAVRNQAWFGLGGALLAADTLARGGRQVPAFSPRFLAVLTGALAGAAAVTLVILAVTPKSQFFNKTPVGIINTAARVALSHPGVHVLGDDYTGTAMLWLHPALLGRVGYDVRFELYDSREMDAYADFLFARGPHWQRVTSGYGIVLASSRHGRLVRLLAGLPGWRTVRRNPAGTVIIRKPA
jgi:hypothetical protein